MAKRPPQNAIKPTTDRTVPAAIAQQADFTRALAYKGNVPLKSFVGWVLLVLLGAAVVGFTLAQMLITQRQNQLVEETATRVALQAQARAGMVSEWLKGEVKVADALAGTQLVRLYVAEMGRPEGTPAPDAELEGALVAQTPYMQQALKDFATRQGAEGVHLYAASGKRIAGFGPAPASMESRPEALKQVVSDATGKLLPLRAGQTKTEEGEPTVVLDVLRPIFQPSQEGTDTPVVGVLWVSLPVGGKLAGLVSTTPLDRPGERTALLQDNAGQALLVGQSMLAPVGRPLEAIRNQVGSGHALSLSVVDGLKTFATLHPIQTMGLATPYFILQEYQAKPALAVMDMYKPGLYAIVGLATAVLGGLMLALTLHLMAQRNTTRVHLLGQTMDALVRMVEARDPYLSGHHARVARLVIKLGNAMKLPVGERAVLYYAAQLSAVGRLLVPRDLLVKKGKLTVQERKDLEGHVQRAQDVLGALEFDLPVVPVIRQMYERVDGSGHPLGLKGPEIHHMAKVLGAADAYCALTSERSHRTALNHEDAMATMAKGGFDKDVLATLKKLGA